MLDESKFTISKNGQVLVRHKVKKAIDLQKKILNLFYKTFDDEDDFQYVNLTLEYVHASKLKDFLARGIITEGAITKMLIDHVSNTETIVEEGNFVGMKKNLLEAR